MDQSSNGYISTLIPKERDSLKYKVKDLMQLEKHKIMDGSIQFPYSDVDLRSMLHNKYEVKTSLRNVNEVRNNLGIPNAKNRIHSYRYFFEEAFSGSYNLIRKEIINHVPQMSGVYEVRFTNKFVNYPNGKSNIIYIGRSVNLKKRLLEHLCLGKNKTGLLEHIWSNSCAFRFYTTTCESSGEFNKHCENIIKRELEPLGCNKKECSIPLHHIEEKRLYDLFIKIYGESPIANKIKPFIGKKN